ncbi:hypothetical protein C8R46DRAFT_1274163 [Mycena filopes]|nr:hypothetical protein C8R46DRAFT_1274163 [Mycena filopes]
MPSKHTPDDEKFIDSLPMGTITAFRSSIYVPTFIQANPHLFVDNQWIDADQLRAFIKPSPTPDSPRPKSPSPRVKLEADTPATRLDPSGVRTRILTEGKREVVEILSDSEDEEVSRGDRESTPLPPSDIPTDTSDMDRSDTVSDFDVDEPDELPAAVSGLQPSDTRWLDPEITSLARIGRFRVTTDVTVERAEYLTEFPSLYPIFATPTAIIINAEHPKFNIPKKGGGIHSVDALIKNKDNDSWGGNTGTGDSKVLVTFEPGKPPILCRRSRLKCKGAFVCERVDPRLLKVERRDLDPASRDAVFAAQRQTRREEGTTAERRVTEFIQLLRGQKCRASDATGHKCQGVPILRSKQQTSRGHRHFVGCSGFRPGFTVGHRSTSIPDDVDEEMFMRGFSGEPLVAGNSKDTAPCSVIVHPTTGLKQRHCPHTHILNGKPEVSAIVNRPCDATRTIYVPVDASIRKALIIHSRNIAHNHPMPALKKASWEVKESYRQCIQAVGCVGATVSKVDNAPSTQLLLDGRRPGEFSPALQSNQVKRKLVREAKLEAYPAGLDVVGAFELFWQDMNKPITESYVQQLVNTPDGGLIILTCLAALMKLLDDEGVTSFETDTTFKRVAGSINEWEVVLFLKSLQRAVTIARAYVNSASADFFERLYDKFQAVKLKLTGKPLAFKRLVEGGNLLALNSDMEAAQVLGGTRSIMKTNNPAYSGISNDTPAEKVAPEFVKLCTTHAKRAVLDFRSLVSDSDYQRLLNFTYIDSEEALNEFSDFVAGLGVKKIQDWWDHKAMSAWILPCLIKSQSPMSAEDWDNTPATTNTGEAQHHWTNSRTGIKLSLVEAIESARKVDEAVVREIETSINSGILLNPHNESSHRRARNLTRQSTTIRKSRESRELADERDELQVEIDAEKAAQKASAARLKELNARKSASGRGGKSRAGRRAAGSSSSGRVSQRPTGSTPLRSSPMQPEPLPTPPVASTSALPMASTPLQSNVPRFEPSSPPIASTSQAPYLAHLSQPHPHLAASAYNGVEDQNVFNFASPAFGSFFVPNTFSASTAQSTSFNFNFTEPNYGAFDFDPSWFEPPPPSTSFDTPSAAPLLYESIDYSYLFAPPDAADTLVASSPPSSFPRLPPVPPSSPPPPTPEPVVEPVPASKKRKSRDEVDPALVLDKNSKRVRRAPKQFDL